jgi:beta-xylosidase
MERLWKSDLGNGTYRNPILFADYSDPDVIRVGDTYYMTASSFNYIPGLPILTSRDLVNWTLKNYALQSIPYENYRTPQHAKGVWAPAIRYHEGTFYIFYGMPDEGVFMVKTRNPLGEWDPPVCVLSGKGLIDPCPFWDDDGKAYVIHAYAKSRIGFKSYLGMFEMSQDGACAVSVDHLLYDGTVTQPTIEGPKVYKRDGFYYIFAPAGGVKTGWQTVLRGADIHGPFEEKIVLRQGNTDINGPHQGGLTDTVNGDDWFVHFQDRGLYGRIVHLEPVAWSDGWPAIGTNIADGCGEPVTEWKCPDTGWREEPCYLEASDSFDGEDLNRMWQWLGNPDADFYSLTERKGMLRLYSKNPSGKPQPVLWECSNVLTQKLVCPEFEAECQLEVEALKEGDRAGLVMMGGTYAFLAVRRSRLGHALVYGTSQEAGKKKTEEVTTIAKLPADAKTVRLFLTLTKGAQIHMYYQMGNCAKAEVEEAASFHPSDHTWVGAKLGIFAVADDVAGECGYADFEYFRVKPV